MMAVVKVCVLLGLVTVTLGFSSSNSSNTPENRILGGSDATSGQFPWQVSLRTSQGNHYCGGSIISDYYVVTATHCIYEARPVFIIAGALSYSGDDGQKYKVAEVIDHEQYQHDVWKNDISLLKLAEKIHFSDKVKPIPIASENIPGGTAAVTSGWGYVNNNQEPPRTLKYLEVTTIENAECEKHWTEATETNICISRPQGSGPCQADSGGPLVANQRLIGITSFGGKTCGTDKPDAFTRVSSYVSWINSKIRN